MISCSLRTLCVESINQIRYYRKNMEEFRKILLTLIFSSFTIIILIFLGIFIVNRFSNKNEEKVTEITSMTIIEKIKDQYFIVTKTVFVDQQTEITVDQGSGWSNFLWGQKIEAEGLVRIDIGVDMNSLSEEDIVIDEETKTIKISLPKAQILDASISDEIELKSSNGVLRKIFRNDPSSDFNMAFEKLISEAQSAVNSDQEVFDESRENSTELLRLIVESLGYKLEIVEIKE